MKPISIALLALFVLSPLCGRAFDLPPLDGSPGRIQAPEFPEQLHWLNSPKAIPLKSLRGKVVLLDFWTYCCINCMHILPQLHGLEEKYKGRLVVLGIHSAKFSAEQADSKIRQAIRRFGITHAVLNDYASQVWDLYGVQGWPTLVLIDPVGRIVGAVSGEGHIDEVDAAIAQLLLNDTKDLSAAPMPVLDTKPKSRQGLAFPSKLFVDEARQRLFVADSGHQRILICSLKDGMLLDCIGSGQAGFQNGSFAQASFRNPQGLALSADGNTLFVADTENHALRSVDLKARQVATLAGDGKQGSPFGGGGKGQEAELNSPWDLWLLPGGQALGIAMAGDHQIWRLNLGNGLIAPWIGNGDEDLKDGSFDDAALAQSSGLCGDATQLFIADSESSSIRVASLGEGNETVATLVGKGLFDFGDKVGPFATTRLQHPLALALDGNILYVADSFNDRIKRFDLQRRLSEDFAGDGKEGDLDGPGAQARFDEPGGLGLSSKALYVADTNNGQIRVVDLKSREVKTLSLQNIPEAP